MVSTYTEVWVTSVRAADGETAKLREGDEAEVVGSDAFVPLREWVRKGVRDRNGCENERDGEV